MPIFLYESVHLVPGQTVEYLRAFAERWLPLSDEYDSDLYTLSGFFQPDVLYNTQPTVNILWTIHSWEVWDGRHARGSVEEHLRKTHEFYTAAVGWRSGWTDKIIEPLSFSPLPPTRPEAVRAGSTFFDHKFVVRPEKCGEFVDTFRNDVLPAATAQGLTLELFARGGPSYRVHRDLVDTERCGLHGDAVRSRSGGCRGDLAWLRTGVADVGRRRRA